MLGLLLGRRAADSGAVGGRISGSGSPAPDFAQAYNNIGLVLTQAGDDEPAITAFREAVRIKPDYADATPTWAQP